MAYFDDLRFCAGDIYPECRNWFDHRWPGTYSLELKLGGRLSLSRDGERSVVCPGPVLFWHHPRHRYRYGPPAPGDWWHHHWVLFMGERGRRLIEDGFDLLAPCGWMEVAAPRAMGTLFRDLVAAVRSHDPRRHGQAILVLEHLLIMAQQQQASNDSEVLAVAEAVRSDPLRTWDWDQEARSLQISTAQFRRRFRRVTGAPPHAWLIRARMHAAAEQLSLGRPEITALAQDLGLAPAHFSRTFKSVMGIGPKAFRDRHPSAPAGGQPSRP